MVFPITAVFILFAASARARVVSAYFCRFGRNFGLLLAAYIGCRIVRVQSNRPVPVQRMGAKEDISPVNPAVAARAREIMEQRAKENEEKAKQSQAQNAAQIPSAAPVISFCQRPLKVRCAQLGGNPPARCTSKC